MKFQTGAETAPAQGKTGQSFILSFYHSVFLILTISYFSPAVLASPLLQYEFSQPYFQTQDSQGQIINGIVTKGMQGNNGILWLATQNGLVEYDGYQYRRHTRKANDEHSLPGNYIIDIAQQDNGKLWLATRASGLASYDARAEKFQRFSINDENSVIASNALRSVFISKNQTVWVGHEAGVDHLTEKGQLIRQYTLPVSGNSTVYSIFEPREGVIWVGGSFGLVEIVGDTMTVIPQFRQIRIRRIFKDADGIFWFGSKDGLWFWPGCGEVQRPQGLNSQDSQVYVKNMVQSDDGTLWVGTYGSGIWMLDARTKQLLRKFKHDPSVSSSLAFNDIGHLILDKDQNLWIGTWGGGLQKLVIGGLKHFAAIRYSLLHNNTLSYGNIRSIQILQDGLWVFGRTGFGLDIFEPGSGRIETIEYAQTGERIRDVIALMEDKQSIVWAGGSTQGLFRIDMNTRQARAFKTPELEKTTIRAMMLRSNGDRIVGTGIGVCILQPQQNRCRLINLKDGTPVAASATSLAEDNHGQLWLGTNKGLYRNKRNTDYFDEFSSRTNALTGDAIKGIIRNDKGLYVVSDREFLLITDSDKAEPKFTELSKDLNLGNRKPGGNMLLDKQGRLWSASSIVDFEKKQFTRLNSNKGVFIGTVWLGSYAQLPSGLMLFGGVKGVLLINPESYQAVLPQSEIVIRQYKVNGRAHPLPNAGQILLDETSRAFSMQVAALDINSSRSISYEYRLTGQSDDWLPLDANSRWIQYTNLSPGQYRLEVKGKLPYDEGEVKPLSIGITVAPAFWQTLWFKLGLVLLLLLLVHVFIRWRTNFLKARAFQLEEMVNHKSQELDAVNAIGREFTTHLTLDDVFQEIYQHIKQIVSVDVFGIGLLDQQQSNIVFEYAIEQDVRFNRYSRSMEHPEQLAVFCVQQNRSILINDYNLEFEKYHPIQDERLQMLCDGTMSKSASSMIYVPMAIQRKVIGVIGMQSFLPDSYAKSDVTILETLASYGAIALANAKSHENLQSLHQQLEASHNELKQTQEKLIMQEKMAALGQLVAGVAHEINTPLGIAVTGISVLDDKLTELERRIEDNRLKRNTLENTVTTCIESLGLIKPNLNKTAALVQQFKRVSPADNNANVINVDIGELLRQVKVSALGKLSTNGVTVELAGPETLMFDTMPSVLSQVIQILLNNALQHAFSEQTEGKIVLRYSLDDDGLTIACEDNGCGISAEQKDKIFAPFYTSSRQSGAMGLGLSIAFNIVNIQLAGTLTLYSECGKGATFIVKLP